MTINVVDEFLKLVSINSPSKFEGELADYLKNRLKELGAEVMEDDSGALTGSNTGNIYAKYPGNADGPSILLAAHMDTIVSTEGMIPQIRNQIIYSDGKTILGADDKAGIAVILAVISRLGQQGLPHGPIEILFTVQEEVGLIGIKNIRVNFQSRFGYVLDGDGPVGTIINASPSHILLDLIIEGKAAHAGLAPENGINAIIVASKALAELPSGRLDQETTSNIGIISGGKARNIVADRVEIQAEVRSRNKEKLEIETNKIIAKFKETAAQNKAGFTYTQELAYDAFTIPQNHPAIAHAISAGNGLGLKINVIPTGGGLDANILNAMGIDCVALGLGNGNPHTNEEFVSIDEMEKAVEYLIKIMAKAADK